MSIPRRVTRSSYAAGVTGPTWPRSWPTTRTRSRGRHRSSRRWIPRPSRSTRRFDCSRCLGRSVSIPPTGVEIVAMNGRYGPFIKKGSESRSLESEEQIFTLTVEEALALLAQPKQRGRRAAAAPLRELGADPRLEQSDPRQGRPLRALRHGRGDEREPTHGRHRRGVDARASGRDARRTPLPRPAKRRKQRKR